MTLSDEDDLTAAEYALGTLEATERVEAARRREREPAFAAAVAAWEQRFAALSEAIGEAEPSAGVWSGILARIGALPRPASPADGAEIVLLHRRLRNWRVATLLTGALAAALALWVAAVPSLRLGERPAELVAFLQKTGDAPAYVMAVSLDDERLAVRPIAAVAPAGKSYELWIIDPQLGPPRSLGVIDGPVTKRTVPTAIGRDVLSRATYAVTLEAAGGSPDGKPTGAPVFSGHLVAPPR